MKTVFLFSLICAFLVSGALHSQTPSGGEKLLEEMGKENISREEAEVRGDNEFKAAKSAFEAGEYKKSVDLYIKAKNYLLMASSTSPHVKRKVEVCDEAVSKVYSYWAKEIMAKAEEAMNSQDYDTAISHCEQAKKIYPASKEKMNRLIAECQKMRKVTEYRKSVSEESVDPDKKTRQYSIDVLLKQGQQLFKDGSYDKAREKFEDVLVQDPYNMQAIESLRVLSMTVMEKGKKRSAATKNERTAEVEWKLVTPIVPRTLGGETDSIATPVKKADSTDRIRQKLKEIKLDRLEFDDVSIPTVVKYLKQRSKQLDPEHVGVNIFLRLLTPEEKAAASAKGENGESKDEDSEEWGDDAKKEKKDGGAKSGGGTGGMQTLNLRVDDITLEDAINYICKSSGLKSRIEKNAVILASPEVPLDDVETKIYALDSEALDKTGSDSESLTTFFKNQGVKFPTGAKVVYDNRISRLIATNTPDNLKVIEDIIQTEFNSIDPQVLIQAKFVEVAQNDLDELGFEWYVSRSTANIDYINGGNMPVSTLDHIFDNTKTTRQFEFPVNTYDSTGTYTGTVQPNTQITSGANTVYYKKAYSTPLGDRNTTFGQNSNVLRNVRNDGLGDIIKATPASQDKVLDYTYYTSDGYKIQAMIHALDQCDTADVLSAPRVTTMNGQEATIRMVTEEYYPESWTSATMASVTGQAGQGNTTVFIPSIPQFESEPTELGILLTVTPTVDADRYTISLKMAPVVQAFAGWTDYSYDMLVGNPAVTRSNTLKMPIIEKRTAETQVSIYDGETIIIGGVIKDKIDTYNDKIPVLGDIPMLGRIFQSQAKRSKKVNLLIFLTCRLVHPDGSPLREREQRGLPNFKQ